MKDQKTDFIVDKKDRIKVVDALRGFAVMAILLVHNIEHFIFPVYPANSPEWLSVLNSGVLTSVFALFAGKAYAIFALLFGFTFYIQTNNARKKGYDFGYRFLWRLVLLAVFATINAAFFPAGDVLLLFVIVALILFAARNWSNKAILTVAIIFLLQPFEWYNYLASLINPMHILPDLGVGRMYEEVAVYTKEGNFWKFIWGNVTLGQKASFLWAVDAGRFFQTGGLFLLGFYIGRKQLFSDNKANYIIWTKILIISAISFGPLLELKQLIGQTDDVVVKQTAEVIFDMWQKLSFTFVLISSFVLFYKSEKFQYLVRNLQFYGRMSLTNYISQSIIGAFIYFPFGLYLAPYCGYACSLLIGILIFIMQMKFSKWWLQRHKQGPLEYVWHKWTWIKFGKNRAVKYKGL